MGDNRGRIPNLGVVERHRQNELQVVLAESWTTSLDGRVYTFKLSQGVKFNNGYPYDAPVVKYSIN